MNIIFTNKTCRSAVHAIGGDTDEARRIAMGMGRATGRAVCGGGLLSEVPGFKELDKCGKSLGDVIGGGDEESARKRWTEEYVKEYKDPANWANAGISVASAAMWLTGPANVLGAAAVGAGIGAGEDAAKQGVNMGYGKQDKFDFGDMIGSGLQGAYVDRKDARAGKKATAKGKAPRTHKRHVALDYAGADSDSDDSDD